MKTTTADKQPICTKYTNDNNYWMFGLRTASSTTWGLMFGAVSGGVNKLFALQEATSNWTTNTWYHVAVVRNGSNIKLYRDGVELTISSNIDSVPTISSALYIGSYGIFASDRSFDGYIDELRISKGIARWTSNFTPGSSEYGASAIGASADVTDIPFILTTSIQVSSVGVDVGVVEPTLSLTIGIEVTDALVRMVPPFDTACIKLYLKDSEQFVDTSAEAFPPMPLSLVVPPIAAWLATRVYLVTAELKLINNFAGPLIDWPDVRLQTALNALRVNAPPPVITVESDLNNILSNIRDGVEVNPGDIATGTCRIFEWHEQTGRWLWANWFIPASNVDVPTGYSYWATVAVSGNGKYMYAQTRSFYYPARSENYGVTWAALKNHSPLNLTWRGGTKVSYDGSTVFMCGGAGFYENSYPPACSLNYGVNFAAISGFPYAYWYALGLSGNGKVAIIGKDCGGYAVYITRAFPESWTRIPGNIFNGFSDLYCSMSYSGRHIYMGTYSNSVETFTLYASHDAGYTWNIVASVTGTIITSYNSIVRCSYSGRYVCFVNKNKVYVSTDFGNSWTITDSLAYLTQGVSVIAITGDGGTIISAGPQKKFIISYDHGVTWEVGTITFTGGSIQDYAPNIFEISTDGAYGLALYGSGEWAICVGPGVYTDPDPYNIPVHPPTWEEGDKECSLYNILVDMYNEETPPIE